MRTSRSFLVGVVVVALLGLSGVGAAAAADKDWYKSDPVWQEQNKLYEDATKAIADNPVAQAAARARLKVLAGDRWWWDGWYWRMYRQVWPVAWQGKWKEAEDRLLQLEADIELLPAQKEAAWTERYRIEVMSDSEIAEHKARTAKKSVQLADEGTLPVPGWGDTKVEQGAGVGYRIWCVSYGKDTDYSKANGWGTPRSAHDAQEFAVQMEYCRPPNPRPKDMNYLMVIRLVTKSPTGTWEISDKTPDMKKHMDSEGNISTFTKDVPIPKRKN